VTPDAGAPTIRTFREDANGSAITMSVGEVIRVELESIPTAGYIWNVAERPQFLELAGEGQRPTNPEKQNQPGFTGGNHYLATDFKAIAPGEGTLVLKEGRPWETDEPATDTFTLTVTVKAAG
jgi:inhibitor of cysteine peptidase